MRWNIALSCGLVALGGCKPRHAVEESAAPSLAPPPGVASAAAPSPIRDEHRSASVGCRAIAVDGEVSASLEGEAGRALQLAAQGEIPNDAWLLLAARARVVAKDPRTTRETSFFGPARVQACVGRREESWIAQGTFESAPGAGEAPGAEEWVTTPHGVVRYVAAKLRVFVAPRETTVRLAQGMAFLWAVSDVQTVRLDEPDAGARPDEGRSDELWQRVSSGTLRIVAQAQRAPEDAARSLVDACSVAAQRSEDLARVLYSGETADGSDLGRTIAEQITARRIARASCSVAGLRVSALNLSDTRAALSRMLERANARWSNLPERR